MNNYDPYTEFQLLSFLLKHKAEKLAEVIDGKSFNHTEAVGLLEIMNATILVMKGLLEGL